ncbi:hypothetical protein LQZ19_02605 [Treponema primitia]|uniref:hypothetical protein n=1 Tax=Treponema primitia TaxID=88058 RepID=UPI00397FD57D
MDDKEEYEISTHKESLNEWLVGTAANYYHYSRKIGVSNDVTHPLYEAQTEIYALKREIENATTMEELDAIRDKAFEYNHKLADMKHNDTLEK